MTLKIDYGDIFGRSIENKNINNIKHLRNKKFLVTVSNLLGSELCKIISKTNINKLVIIDQNETALFYLSKQFKTAKPEVKFILGDITNSETMKNIFVNRITHVYHAAAYKHVNLLKNITECVYNNIFGIINVINSIPKNLESFTLISTDKAAAPSSVMGMTKRVSEIICQNELHKNKTKTRLSIVRFGNVFGSNGSAIQIFLKQIENREPITITDKKVERYFMTVEEACILVLNSSFLSLIMASMY